MGYEDAVWETRSGVVTDLTMPANGKAKGKVGGRAVTVFTKAYQSDEDSEIWLAIKQAFESGESLGIRGTIYDGIGKDGKPYKSFTAKALGNEEDAANGSSPTGKAGGNQAASTGVPFLNYVEAACRLIELEWLPRTPSDAKPMDHLIAMAVALRLDCEDR